MGKETQFSSEVKERAVRLVYEQQKESSLSQWAIICSVASKIGCSAEKLRHWIRRDEINTAEREEFKRLQKENHELKKANEILRLASAYFAKAEHDRQQR